MTTSAQIQKLRTQFTLYIDRYRELEGYDGFNVRLKEEHSLEVCRHCIAIAQSLNLSQEEIYLAEAAGLFHDIGRFEQLKRYGTFNDKTTINHGLLGVEVLDSEKFLADLPAPQQQIIRNCTRFHGNRDLPIGVDGVSKDSIFFLKILRDADKIDILHILTQHYGPGKKADNPALVLDLPNCDDISPEVVADILDSRSVDMKHARTVNDFKLLQISWVFDFNFTYSQQYIAEHQFLSFIFSVLPDTLQVKQVMAHVRQHVAWLVPSPGNPSGQ